VIPVAEPCVARIGAEAVRLRAAHGQAVPVQRGPQHRVRAVASTMKHPVNSVRISVGWRRARADRLGREVDRVAVRASRDSGVQPLQRGELAVVKAAFRHGENVKVAAFRPPVTQHRGPGDVDVERNPRLARQAFRSGWHVPEDTAQLTGGRSARSKAAENR
jgi:hypothetical protein